MALCVSEQSQQKATVQIFSASTPTGKFNIKLSEVFSGSPRLAAEQASFWSLSNACCSYSKKDGSQCGQSVFFLNTIPSLAGPLARLAQVRRLRRVTFLLRLPKAPAFPWEVGKANSRGGRHCP